MKLGLRLDYEMMKLYVLTLIVMIPITNLLFFVETIVIAINIFILVMIGIQMHFRESYASETLELSLPISRKDRVKSRYLFYFIVITVGYLYNFLVSLTIIKWMRSSLYNFTELVNYHVYSYMLLLILVAIFLFLSHRFTTKTVAVLVIVFYVLLAAIGYVVSLLLSIIEFEDNGFSLTIEADTFFGLNFSSLFFMLGMFLVAILLLFASYKLTEIHYRKKQIGVI